MRAFEPHCTSTESGSSSSSWPDRRASAGVTSASAGPNACAGLGGHKSCAMQHQLYLCDRVCRISVGSSTINACTFFIGKQRNKNASVFSEQINLVSSASSAKTKKTY